MLMKEKFPLFGGNYILIVRTKETEVIMVLLNNNLKLGFVTRKMVPQKCMSYTFHLWTALSKSLFQFVNNVA